MTENQMDRTLNYGRFGLVIGKPKPNRPMVFCRLLPGVTQAEPAQPGFAGAECSWIVTYVTSKGRSTINGEEGMLPTKFFKKLFQMHQQRQTEKH